MLRRDNHTVFQQSAGGAGPEGTGPEGRGACRGSIALSKTPIMRAHRRHAPKKFPASRPAEDIIKLESEEEEEEEDEEEGQEEEEEEEDRENMEPPRLSPAPPPPPPPPRLVTATPLQLQHGLGGVLQIKAGVGGGLLPPGTLAQVLSALQSQQGAGGGGHSQLLIPLSSIPTYNTNMDNNVLLLSAYSRWATAARLQRLGYRN